MKNEFEILTAFLENVEPEVMGHSAAPVSEDEKALIAKFANGNLSEAERASLLPLLVENEKALKILADSANKG